jgi:hypothetical protein
MTEYKTMTEEEFLTEGKRLFGEDKLKWEFQCPCCGNIQTAEDFRKHKGAGATPDSAYTECIGRYQKDSFRAFGENKKGAKKYPCDYAAYGLFRIGHIIKLSNGKETVVFPFVVRTGLRCNRCHRIMKGSTAYDGTCSCGGLIEVDPLYHSLTKIECDTKRGGIYDG